MTWRFRRVSELLQDLRQELLTLSEGGAPLLREVRLGRGAQAAQALQLLDQCAGDCAAAILPGPVEHLRAGARNQREVKVMVYLRRLWPGEQPACPGAVHDLADRVSEHFLPAADRPQQPRELAGVAWEALGQEPLGLHAGGELILVKLLARDFRGPRND